MITCECPKCGGLLGYLGHLGKLVWYQCRQCGWETSYTRDEVDLCNCDEN